MVANRVEMPTPAGTRPVDSYESHDDRIILATRLRKCRRFQRDRATRLGDGLAVHPDVDHIDGPGRSPKIDDTEVVIGTVWRVSEPPFARQGLRQPSSSSGGRQHVSRRGTR